MGSITTKVTRYRKPIIFVMAGAMVLSMSAAVGAASPQTEIKACVNKTTKDIRISKNFNSNADCRSNEAFKKWAIAGAQGVQGVQGNTGATGGQGTQGVQGNTGATGTGGSNGTNGSQGVQGNTGADGQGVQGETGAAGGQGVQGETGANGGQGVQGETGWQGVQGETGAAGGQGVQGDTGEKGDPGSVGATSIEHSAVSTNANTVKTDTLTASCPAGTKMIAGGGNTTTNDSAEKAQLSASYPTGTNEWTVTATAKVGAGKTWTLQAFVLCADD